MKYLQWLSLGLVILFLSVRLMTLVTLHPGFFVDESSIGLNAELILRTGVDQHGKAYPLFFEAFGEYKNPIYIYSVVPILAALGASIFSVRLTSFLWCLAAVFVLFILIRKADLPWYQIAIILLLTVSSPWYISLSGTAFEVASLPFFLLTTCLSLFILSEKKSGDAGALPWSIIAGVSLGLFFYSYTAARLLTPPLVLAAAVLVWKNHSWKLALVVLFAAAVCAVPLLFSESVMTGALFARYSVVGLHHYVDNYTQWFVTVAQQYLAHFSPDYLLYGGDHNLRHVIDPYGIVLFAAVPFLIAGLVALYKKTDSFSRWCLFGLLISPIPSALTIQSPHVLRAIAFSVFLVICYWYGVRWWFTGHSLLRNKLAVVLTLLLFLNAARFLVYTVTLYPQQARAWYDADTVQLVQEGAQYPGPYYVSEQLYPGTEATLGFFILANSPSQKTIPDIEYAAPIMRYPILPGIYVLDTASCHKMRVNYLQDLNIKISNAAGCVWQTPEN